MVPGSNDNFRVVFAGTPAFAAEILLGLCDAGFDIPVVLTQPDRPAGRGRKPRLSAVKVTALAKNISVLQPQHIDQTVVETIRRLEPALVAVAAYGLLLPAEFLTVAPLGCINLHASVLPRWRGAAPIQRAILAGDRETGVTVMQMDEGLDTGDILDTQSCPIHPGDTSQTLHDRLAALGRALLPASLLALSEGALPPRPQDAALSTYAARVTKAEGLLIWSDAANALERRVRAFNPWPVAFTHAGGQRLRIWQAKAKTEIPQAPPGVVSGIGDSGIDVATGDAILCLEKIQLPGARVVTALDMINTGRLLPGTRLHG